MDNAPRALRIAGGILIALMIISVVMMFVFTLRDYYKAQSDSSKASQIAEINNQFEPYIKEELTLMEMKSLYNKIESYKNKSGNVIQNNIKKLYDADKRYVYTIDDPFSKVDQISKVVRTFKFVGDPGYDQKTGIINYMWFEETTSEQDKSRIKN